MVISGNILLLNVESRYMNLFEFNALNEEDKIEATLFNGIFLATYSNRLYKKDLYRIGDIYVEVVYHIGTHDIFNILGFDQEVMLGPYLDQIDLSSLFK